MAMNAQYAGGLELNAIATAYGLHLTVFQRTPDGINRLGGMANAGTTILDDWWTERRLNAARNLGLFEGQPDEGRRIAFGIASAEQIAGVFAHPPADFLVEYGEFNPGVDGGVGLAALAEHYGALRGADYRAPIEVGMYRHQDLAHWSAVTNAEGHGDLDGEGDRLGDAEIPELLDGAGLDDWYDWEPDDGGSSGGKQAKVTFARKPRTTGRSTSARSIPRIRAASRPRSSTRRIRRCTARPASRSACSRRPAPTPPRSGRPTARPSRCRPARRATARAARWRRRGCRA
jgi:hypothetical protein